jgi:iron-sulfur cluster insertion protein
MSMQVNSYNEANQAVPPSSVVFTQQAASRVWQLIQEEGNLNLNLRVFITGGGCSGFQYGFTFDETINGDDTIIEQIATATNDGDARVRLLVDPMSLQYLLGAEIDFKSDLNGEQFVIRNPNAKTTCGCGSSFDA